MASNATYYVNYNLNNLAVSVVSLSSTQIRLTVTTNSAFSCGETRCQLDIYLGNLNVGSCSIASRALTISYSAAFGTGIGESWTPSTTCAGNLLRLTYSTSFANIFVGNGNSFATSQFMHITVNYATISYLRYEKEELDWNAVRVTWQGYNIFSGVWSFLAKGEAFLAPESSLAASLSVATTASTAAAEN